ncbi:MAG: superoxide dismutase family protein [Candidatus Rokuibacteriota bacterium]|nr:MAG: superoxide dismutase family protein [Candidatus Rokubacteria bacterium]
MRAFVAVVASLLLAGCAGMGTPSNTDNTARAEMKNAGGQPVGAATFTQVANTVRVVLEVQGLPPGQHGVHVHTVGKCDPPDFASAGGHFNPLNREHGALNPRGAHAGDLPNLTVGPDGKGRLESTTELFTLGNGPTSIFDSDGSALVIHAAPDDFKTDPTGNSGARIACGVIVKK